MGIEGFNLVLIVSDCGKIPFNSETIEGLPQIGFDPSRLVRRSPLNKGDPPTNRRSGPIVQFRRCSPQSDSLAAVAFRRFPTAGGAEPNIRFARDPGPVCDIGQWRAP